MGFLYSWQPPINANGQSDYSSLSNLRSWHYRHVALCLNERRTKLNIAQSLDPLDTETPDKSITYTHINAARRMIEAMCIYLTPPFTPFFAKDDAELVDGVSTFIELYFTSIGQLLKYCGRQQSDWTGITNGQLVFEASLTAGSTLILKMISELADVVEKMTTRYRYGDSAVSNYTLYGSEALASKALAWADRTHTTISTRTSTTLLQRWQSWYNSGTPPAQYSVGCKDASDAITYNSLGTASKQIRPLGYVVASGGAGLAQIEMTHNDFLVLGLTLGKWFRFPYSTKQSTDSIVYSLVIPAIANWIEANTDSEWARITMGYNSLASIKYDFDSDSTLSKFTY